LATCIWMMCKANTRLPMCYCLVLKHSAKKMWCSRGSSSYWWVGGQTNSLTRLATQSFGAQTLSVPAASGVKDGGRPPQSAYRSRLSNHWKSSSLSKKAMAMNVIEKAPWCVSGRGPEDECAWTTVQVSKGYEMMSKPGRWRCPRINLAETCLLVKWPPA
jgi:hypothetical protein